MATLTVYDAQEGGGITFTAAASGGDVFPNDGKTIFVIYNANAGASRTVTFTAQDTTAFAPGFGAVTKSDATEVVEQASVDVMGPFPTSAFNNASGQAVVTYTDSAADLTVAAIRVN